MPLLVHPCYLLRRKGRVDGGRDDGSEGAMLVRNAMNVTVPSRAVATREEGLEDVCGRAKIGRREGAAEGIYSMSPRSLSAQGSQVRSIPKR